MKILVVEDDAQTARFLTGSLKRSGHDVILHHSAESARDYLLSSGVDACPVCVIDLALPGRDGIWLCRWIRDQSCGASPYLLVGTGSDHREKLRAAFDAGADDYVEKPYESRLLQLRLAVADRRVADRREHLRLSQALEEEQRLVTTVFDTAAACIVALDAEGGVAKINEAACFHTGIPMENLIGRNFSNLFPDLHGRDALINSRLSELLTGAEPLCHFETQIRIPGGECRDLAWVCQRSESSPETPPSDAIVVCVGSDITERRRLESQLAFLAERDPLTHLYNRSQLDPALRRALDGTRDGQPAALLSLDLDDFKIVNDRSGHAAGDDLLRAVAQTITRQVRPSDTVIRLGGDEFVVILSDTPAEAAELVAERIRRAIQQLNFTAAGDRPAAVTASIGLTALQPRMMQEEALASADAACYASKRAGRNLVTRSNGHDFGEAAEDIAWHGRLVEAIARDAIDLWLQPIVALDSGITEFQEILLRLPGSEGACPPDQFLPPARRYNLLPDLDRCVIRNALDLIQFDPSLSLSINLSGRTVSDPRLGDFLLKQLRRTGVDPDRILFEITESELISDLPLAMDRLGSLRARGFRFALDDFGHGYSSFRYLRDLPVEIVKIDGSFTRTLTEDPASAAFIRAITDLCHAIGLRCVAEHVEDEECAALLRELHVDLAQGFHLGRPQSCLTRTPARRAPSGEGLVLPK